MRKRRSAGILLYRHGPGGLEVFLVHPGGPYWQGKDEGAWSIPKGEYERDEDPLQAAQREFLEETGQRAEGIFRPLTPVGQGGGKIVHAWAVEGDLDPDTLVSNRFPMEWPPGSGSTQAFPEIDRGDWFDVAAAMRKILPAQRPLLDELRTVTSRPD